MLGLKINLNGLLNKVGLGYRLFWTPYFSPYLWVPPILIKVTNIPNKILFIIIVLNHNMKCLENMQVCVCINYYVFFLVRSCYDFFFFSKYIRFMFMYIFIHNNYYFYSHKSIRISFNKEI